MRIYSYLIIFCVITLFGCNKGDDTTAQKKVYFLVAGQSNAVGVGDSLKSTHQNNIDVVEYNSRFDDIQLLNDPVGQYNLGFQKAQTGSFIPALGYEYNQVTNNQVLVVQTAKGGSSLTKKAETNNWGNWSPKGKLFKNSIIKVKMMQSCLAEKGKSQKSINAIFWCQGENDGDAISKNLITKENYKNALANLIQRYQKQLGNNVPFIIVETGRFKGDSIKDQGYKKVREAQREVAHTMDHVFIGYDETEFFIDRDWLKAVVHYNQEALNDIGKKLADFYVSIED